MKSLIGEVKKLNECGSYKNAKRGKFNLTKKNVETALKLGKLPMERPSQYRKVGVSEDEFREAGDQEFMEMEHDE